MSFRRKLLSVFALTVVLSVAAVAMIVSWATRRAFARANEQRTAALVAQFRREFNRRGEDIAQRVQAIASSETATRMALASSTGPHDYGTYLGTAKNLADNQQLDYLEIADDQGIIISSAQWPGKFGYKENFPLAASTLPKDAFLKPEELPDGIALGLFAIRPINAGDTPLYVIGGRTLDRNFLASLELPPGMRALLYQNLAPTIAPQLLIDSAGPVEHAERILPFIRQVQQQPQEMTTLIHWSSDASDDETLHAFPLTGQDKQLFGILLVGSSRREYVELRRHIRSAALLGGSVGIVLAILFSGWTAARVTRPVEQLAEAAREVTAGNWSTQVPVSSSDELGELAESFNRMTRELLDQKERLVQSERVAAWRELARRLAHELKNPLFPLQLTVENLIRARERGPEQFDEVFRESSATLLTEISNLKGIIGRFSEFSKMPQPQFQQVQLNEVIQNVAQLFQAQFRPSENAAIDCKLDLGQLDSIAADPELLHRAISNLVLNAMDAMPQGGTLALRTHQEADRVFAEITDTGTGLTPEECERIFTPYYTSKSHGTGLGLAIVQSVISDHGGRISVRSNPGEGTTFIIELPKRRAN